jgi:hypothetical protein
MEVILLEAWFMVPLMVLVPAMVVVEPVASLPFWRYF